VRVRRKRVLGERGNGGGRVSAGTKTTGTDCRWRFCAAVAFGAAAAATGAGAAAPATSTGAYIVCARIMKINTKVKINRKMF